MRLQSETGFPKRSHAATISEGFRPPRTIRFVCPGATKVGNMLDCVITGYILSTGYIYVNDNDITSVKEIFADAKYFL